MKSKLFVLMLLAVHFTACNKEEATPECEATAQLCVNLGNERISGAAIWYRIPNQNRFRLLWEEGTGSTYRNIEIDLYTSDTVLVAGSYPTNDSHTRATSAVQYFAASQAWYGTGTLNISSIEGNKVSGTFSDTLTKDGSTETMEYSSGQLKSVPQQ
jgi:hypothetical protein